MIGIYAVQWYNPRPYEFGFNKVLMPGYLNFVRYQFQIIDHGFLLAHFNAKQSPKNTKGNIAMYINKR